MRGLILAGGLIVATAIPAFASAETRCEQRERDNRVAGTVVGAIAGGLLGNAVSSGGGRSGGTAIGAVGGAVVGNQLARGGHCPDGYTAYDDARPASDYGRDTSAYAPGYSDRGWRDQDGRYCHWSDQTYRDAYGDWGHRWVQACR